ncbi:MAG TPA: hypothetical protein VN229_04985 [Terriglobales bacterium]|nr:hypothetical protein [Terriglobales bacterium]
MLEKFIDANNRWFGAFVCVLLVLFVLAYRPQDFVWPVALLTIAMLILAKRYGRRLEALETEISALRAQLAAASLLVLNQTPGQG